MMTSVHPKTAIVRGLQLLALLFGCFLVPAGVKSEQPQQCGGCFTTNCFTFPISSAPGPWCIGCDGYGFLGNTAYGCSSLANASATECDDNMCGPDGGHYSGAAMSGNSAFGDHALYNNGAGGNYNSAFGSFAMSHNIIGTGNSAFGAFALESSTGNDNTAFGSFALQHNTGNDNTAVGAEALPANSTGFDNTGLGANVLSHNTTGSGNTAAGAHALENSTSNGNAAFGALALENNTTGGANTAVGWGSLSFTKTGYYNTAVGYGTLGGDQTIAFSTAVGAQAMVLSSGTFNDAFGYRALSSNTTGVSNTALGNSSLYNNSTGFDNVAVGSYAGFGLTTGGGNVCIGYAVFGVAGESNTTRIRNIYSSVTGGRAVYVSSDNKIGTLPSSRRFKEEIKPMDNASETLLALKPMTFRYKKEVDAAGVKQFGLVAEEVDKVNPELVTRDEEGKPETVRYEAVNAMLLNEFLKEHKKVEQQQQTIDELRSTVERLAAEMREQARAIQRSTRDATAYMPKLAKPSDIVWTER